MLACVVPWQTMASTLIECTFIFCAGPWSWYCSCTEVFPFASALALPPKLALSPLFAVMRPPLVIVIVQSGVVTGSTHVLVAAPLGSPTSCVPSSSVSAKAVIASAPGSAGPW